MKGIDVERTLQAWFDAVEPQSEPAELLSAVFAVTARAGQRRGLLARLATALQGSRHVPQWDVRPLVNVALLMLLLTLLLFGAAFAGGYLRPPSQAGFRQLDPTPIAGELSQVASVAAIDSGFVAVGHSAPAPTGDCDDEVTRGRLWTSADGNDWVERSAPQFRGSRLEGLVRSGPYLYVRSEPAENCSGLRPGVRGFWRSADGLTWERLPETSEVFSMGNTPLMTDVAGTLVAVGLYQEPPPASSPDDWGEPETRVWTTGDGSEWRRVAAIDRHVAAMVALGDVLAAVSFAMDEPDMSILYSLDTGRTWLESDFIGNQSQAVPNSIVSGNGILVAVGDGVSATSMDGRSWTVARHGDDVLSGAQQLWALPNGFLAVAPKSALEPTQPCVIPTAYPSAQPTPEGGAQPTPSNFAGPIATPAAEPSAGEPPAGECRLPEGDGARTWFSADGTDWQPASDIPPPSPEAAALEPPDGWYELAVGRATVVISERPYGSEVWFAPLTDFEP